jgi:hypothetical protein
MSRKLLSRIQSGANVPGDRLGVILLRFDIGACICGVSASSCLLLICRNLEPGRRSNFASSLMKETIKAGFANRHPLSHCFHNARPHTIRPGPSQLGAAVFTRHGQATSDQREIAPFGRSLCSEIEAEYCRRGSRVLKWCVHRYMGMSYQESEKGHLRVGVEAAGASLIGLMLFALAEAATLHERSHGYHRLHALVGTMVYFLYLSVTLS